LHVYSIFILRIAPDGSVRMTSVWRAIPPPRHKIGVGNYNFHQIKKPRICGAFLFY